MKKLYLMLSMLFAFGTAANAVPAKKLQKVITLANGAKVSVELRGDEYLSWWEGADGTAYRATADDAVFEAFDLEAQKPAAAARRARTEQGRAARLARVNNSLKGADDKMRGLGGDHITYKGVKKGLVVLVDFKNKKFADGHDLEYYKQIINGIWIRIEPSDTSPITAVIPAADVPGVCFPIDAMRGITFVSAHPKSPMRGCRDWSAGIIGLGELATSQKQGDITVVLGDLNSGTDHPSFRKLLDAGFQDAALTEAKGRRATFPSWLPWPRLILDHILFTAGLTASDVRSFTVNGTDHLALAATLTLK